MGIHWKFSGFDCFFNFDWFCQIRFKKKNGQVTNTASIKTNRRSIAKVKTFINLNKTK